MSLITLQRFDGSIPKENAENLAADIAEFLQMRQRSRADTHPVRLQISDSITMSVPSGKGATRTMIIFLIFYVLNKASNFTKHWNERVL